MHVIMFDDFSNCLFDYAISQIASLNVFEKSGDDFRLKENYSQIINDKPGQYSTLNFWITFSVAIESLAKAVLVKCEIDGVFEKAKSLCTLKRIYENKLKLKITSVSGPQIESWSILPTGEIEITEDYLKHSPQVKCERNTWLQRRFKECGFNFLKQVRTCTMGSFPRLFEELEQQAKISRDEFERLAFAMTHLAAQRRNRDAHCYFKIQNVTETIYGQNDLNDIYIPMVNKLTEIFRR